MIDVLIGLADVLLVFIAVRLWLPGSGTPANHHPKQPDSPAVPVEGDGIVDTESEYEKQEGWKRDWLAEHYEDHPESDTDEQHRMWEAQKAYMRHKRR